MIACPIQAGIVNAVYNSATDVPVTASSYTASGNSVEFSLNFAPATGTSLTVVRNTGLGFIQGSFDNLAHGQTVVLSHGGEKFYFTANYHGNLGHDLVLQWTNVRAFAWGGGANGKLGNDSTIDSSLAVPVNTADVLWGKLACSGAAGGGHSLGLCADGTVAAWGLNAHGQLGNNSTTQSNVPVAVTGGALAGETAVAVSAGANHSLALCSDGKVVAWGANTGGQLGDGSTTQRNSPVNVSTSGVLSGKTVVAISAGANHSLALCSDGTVVAWGLNANGQLGDGSTNQRNSPVNVSTAGVLSGKTVVAVSAGAYHSLALCSDGTVVAWGLNSNGQLGDNSTTQRTLPVAVTKTSGALLGKSVMMIAAGGAHSLALCADGSVAAWGSNASGQLGNGNNSQSNLPVAVSQSGILNGQQVRMVAAGAYHSLALCGDGSVATWGMGTSGQLGNNNISDSNVPVLVDEWDLDADYGDSCFAGLVSGSSAAHSLALVASRQTDLGNCGFHKQITYCQSSAADPVLDPDSPFIFNSYADQGPMGALLASSSLTPPAGGTGNAVYEKGSNGLQLHGYFRNKAAMDAAFPTGSYLMKIHTSTPNVYQVVLPLGVEDYPAVPKIISLSNATWVNGALKITNPANDVVITWSNPGNDETWFQVDETGIYTQTGTPATTFTIEGGALMNDTFYSASIMLMNGSGTAAVPGLPGSQAHSAYHVQVRFLIQVGTPVLEEPAMYLLMKNHIQVQSSNSDPVDAPNSLPDSDLAPYSVSAESPAGGTLLGPAGTSFPLNFHADNDGPQYVYLSGPAASPAALNAIHPNGTYTFPGGITIDMPADAYPATAKILTVNGAAPVWNDQGHLALDPTVDNTIAWTAVNVPNFSTQGHQSVYLESWQDFNFEEIEIERGALTQDPGAPPVTSLTIPKSSLTPTYTYLGSIGYATAPTIGEVSPGVYKVGIYEAVNQFMVVALKPQTITFGAIPDKQFPGADFTLGASTSSGLPVTYEVISGPATVSGNTVTLVGAATVTIRASQNGDGVYASATAVTRSFTVTASSKLAAFRADHGLAADGSEDQQEPARDGVANLLKFAFNMIGTGAGQTPALTVPNVGIVAASGSAGLPRHGTDAGKLTVTYIRRKATSAPGVSYEVQFSDTMATGSWAVNSSATEAATSIDADFERVTVTDNAAHAKRFARVRVVAN